MKTFLTISVVVVVAILYLASERDKLVQKSAKQYEECIAEQYGMSPYTYYKLRGEMPECYEKNN